MQEDLGIYVHIPFCVKKCYYCNFNSYERMENKIEEYIEAVCKEILYKSEILSQNKIKTIYFGGGTPSYIDSKYIKKILDILHLFSNNEENINEVTIEVNPNSSSKEKLVDYKNMGINRLSIGLQSTYDDILKYIGRSHNYNDFLDTLKFAKEVGFDNISIDLMYPLPGLSVDMLKESLKNIIELSNTYQIKHISIYNLEIHKNSKLEFLINNGFLTLTTEDEEYEMRNYIIDTLNSNDFNQYEISNFAKKGYESKHNINYWNQGYYLGFGAGAASFYLGSRYNNVESIDKYINLVNSSFDIAINKHDMDKLEFMKEYVILKLRLIQGVNLNEFKRKFGKDIHEIFNEEISKLIKNGLLTESKTNVCLTARGKEVANIVWEEFI